MHTMIPTFYVRVLSFLLVASAILFNTPVFAQEHNPAPLVAGKPEQVKSVTWQDAKNRLADTGNRAGRGSMSFADAVQKASPSIWGHFGQMVKGGAGIIYSAADPLAIAGDTVTQTGAGLVATTFTATGAVLNDQPLK